MLSVLLTGCSGQLGYEVMQRADQFPQLRIHAFDSKSLDITNKTSLESVFLSVKPDVVINAAAYTAVDKAEEESKKAYQVNEIAVSYMAQLCLKHGARMIHISTDFVFSADKNTPYQVNDQTGPLGIYGASKLAGEQVLLEALPESSVIIRTAWVYSTHGNNFVKTMLHLMQDKPSLNVVYDQVGTPSYARNLATACLLAAQNTQLAGVYHWTDLGVTSWYDFAIEIQQTAIQLGILDESIPISPIPATMYPTPAKRPSYSVLDTSDLRSALQLQGQHWRQALVEMLEKYATENKE